MYFDFNEEQNIYREEIISFSRNNLNDRKSLTSFSPEMWKKVSDMGLLGLTISEEYGGMNESYETAAVVIEALGYGCINNGFVFVINNHIWVAQNLIYLYGSKYLKDKYLHNMVKGDQIGAFALTECDAGSDAYNMKTKAVEKENCYILNGSKMFISNGTIADIFIVLAVTNSDQIIAFVVEKTFKGVKTGKEIEKMGLEACPICELMLENCEVPKENILGSIESGKMILMSALEWERCYEFAPHVGAMQRIMEACITYANSRKQFKRSISDFQAVSHKIADMKKNLELSKLMLYKIAWLKDQGGSAFTETAIFKVFVSENYIQACKDALQIFGAYGYTKEYDIERELRDSLACSIYSGTNEVQKNTIFQMVNMEMLFSS
jgi:alkylation response protein AidB-like acyl-CoA dehydrogenase